MTMHNHDLPILEFDESRNPVIDPFKYYQKMDIADVCILCFFQEVIADITKHRESRVVKEMPCECGPHYVRELTHDGVRVAYAHPVVGAAHAAGTMELIAALGSTKFIVVGGGGVLNSEIACGHIVVPTSAIRDEGTSYHYLPPSREVEPTASMVSLLCDVLKRHKVPYLTGKTWTTDAVFRETPSRVARRREEGCIMVEMEAAALFAVAQHHGLEVAQLLYGGDDVSGEEWDQRHWVSRADIRKNLFALALEAAKELQMNQ